MDFVPTSVEELRPLTREDLSGFTICVDVLYRSLADVGEPILSFATLGVTGSEGP